MVSFFFRFLSYRAPCPPAIFLPFPPLGFFFFSGLRYACAKSSFYRSSFPFLDPLTMRFSLLHFFFFPPRLKPADIRTLRIFWVSPSLFPRAPFTRAPVLSPPSAHPPCVFPPRAFCSPPCFVGVAAFHRETFFPFFAPPHPFWSFSFLPRAKPPFPASPF